MIKILILKIFSNFFSKSKVQNKHSIFEKINVLIALKYSGYFALIPQNLDLIDLSSQDTVLNFSHFRLSNKGHLLSRKNLKFDIERLVYIVGLISSIPASNKDSISEDG